MTPKRVRLEICAVSVDYAVAAERAKADRIELCTDLACGGTTPSPALMAEARERLRIPIHVLIRPRPGDFFYSADEFRVMLQGVKTAKDSGMDGVVLGLLDQRLRVDVTRTRELVEFARPLQVTFHRAFDQTFSWCDSLEDVIQTGADRLLTSGCQPTVPEGLSVLARLVHDAEDRILVMPGGGITPANVVRVVSAASAREIHASLLAPALIKVEEDPQKSEIDMFYERVLEVTSLLASHAGNFIDVADRRFGL